MSEKVIKVALSTAQELPAAHTRTKVNAIGGHSRKDVVAPSTFLPMMNGPRLVHAFFLA